MAENIIHRDYSRAAPDFSALVESPERRDPALGGPARGRDRVADERGDPLVVALPHRNCHHVSSGPVPRQPGLEADLLQEACA